MESEEFVYEIDSGKKRKVYVVAHKDQIREVLSTRTLDECLGDEEARNFFHSSDRITIKCLGAVAIEWHTLDRIVTRIDYENSKKK